VRGPVEEVDDPITLLQEALNAPTEPATGDEPTAEYSRLAGLSRELTAELRALAERAQVLRRTTSDQADYTEELGEQVARLESLNLLPESDSDTDRCPICGSLIEEADATILQLVEAVTETRAELIDAVSAEPARRDALNELETRAGELRQRLREVHLGLAALAQDQERIRTFRDQAVARAYIKGRIVQHLEELEQAQEVSVDNLEAQVESLRREMEELEGQLDPENERLQVVSRLNVIGDDMTEWADYLGLEHAAGRARIDAAQLTVVVDTPEGPVPLERMGSASNWVGYHLVAHLALHKWFTLQERPVPRVLMLDQPTQAFYPPDVNPLDVVDVATEELSDDDRRSVEAMFSLISELVRQLSPGLQVIVMDHANLPAQWFQDAVVEVWRGGTKLVPGEWVDRAQ
jgi:uncharacterized coiled-coil DUF342 family protein